MFDFFKKKEAQDLKIDEFDIICPKCMVRMEKEIKGDIILDVCKVCGGTWFDKDEIEKVYLIMKNQEAVKQQISADELAKQILKQQQLIDIKKPKLKKN